MRIKHLLPDMTNTSELGNIALLFLSSLFFIIFSILQTRLVSNLTEDEGAYTSLEKLKEEFVAFYQTVFYSVVKENLAYDENEISQSEIEAVVVAVSKAFASRVFINDKVCIFYIYETL